MRTRAYHNIIRLAIVNGLFLLLIFITGRVDSRVKDYHIAPSSLYQKNYTQIAGEFDTLLFNYLYAYHRDKKNIAHEIINFRNAYFGSQDKVVIRITGDSGKEKDIPIPYIDFDALGFSLPAIFSSDRPFDHQEILRNSGSGDLLNVIANGIAGGIKDIMSPRQQTDFLVLTKSLKDRKFSFFIGSIPDNSSQKFLADSSDLFKQISLRMFCYIVEQLNIDVDTKVALVLFYHEASASGLSFVAQPLYDLNRPNEVEFYLLQNERTSLLDFEYIPPEKLETVVKMTLLVNGNEITNVEKTYTDKMDVLIEKVKHLDMSFGPVICDGNIIFRYKPDNPAGPNLKWGVRFTSNMNGWERVYSAMKEKDGVFYYALPLYLGSRSYEYKFILSNGDYIQDPHNSFYESKSGYHNSVVTIENVPDIGFVIKETFPYKKLFLEWLHILKSSS